MTHPAELSFGFWRFLLARRYTASRARLLVLTDHGRACTRAAQQAAEATVDRWRARLPPEHFAAMSNALGGLALPGRLRPSW